MNEATASALNIDLVDVTPKQAAKWLESNHVNRNLRRKSVDALRRDMENKRWRMTGEPIQFSRTAALINGQHRLSALATADPKKIWCPVCEKAGHIQFLVIGGLEDESQKMMDQGTARNVRDALILEHGHVKNVTLVAAVSRWLSIIDEPGPRMDPNILRTKVTTAEALDAYNRFPDQIDLACTMATRLRRNLMGSPTAVAYSYLAFSRIDPEATNEFFAGMIDEEWSSKNDPRKAAHRRMRTVHYDQGVKVSIETGIMMVSVLTRAWNAWRRGEEVETMNVRTRSGLILPVKPI